MTSPNSGRSDNGADEPREPAYEPMPAAPPVNEQAAGAAPPAPGAVENAFKLWMGIIAISVINAIVTFIAGADAFEDAMRQSGQGLTADQIEQAASTAFAISVVITVALIVLYVLFTFKMRAGRNWARITLTVLGGISLLFTVIGSTQASGLNLVISLISAALVIGAIYFMFRPEANEYYNAAKRTY